MNYYVLVFICRNSFGVPIFERPPPKYSANGIMKLLLDPNIDESRIALKRPVGTTHNATFVVDLLKLDCPDNVKKDNFGKMGTQQFMSV